MHDDRKRALHDDLARVIASHADWLDGRAFQQACVVVAQGYWSAGELDDLVPETEATQRILDAIGEALHSATP